MGDAAVFIAGLALAGLALIALLVGLVECAPMQKPKDEMYIAWQKSKPTCAGDQTTIKWRLRSGRIAPGNPAAGSYQSQALLSTLARTRGPPICIASPYRLAKIHERLGDQVPR